MRPEDRLARLQIGTLAVGGLLTLAFFVWRYGWHRIFTPDWWRP